MFRLKPHPRQTVAAVVKVCRLWLGRSGVEKCRVDHKIGSKTFKDAGKIPVLLERVPQAGLSASVPPCASLFVQRSPSEIMRAWHSCLYHRSKIPQASVLTVQRFASQTAAFIVCETGTECISLGLQSLKILKASIQTTYGDRLQLRRGCCACRLLLRKPQVPESILR